MALALGGVHHGNMAPWLTGALAEAPKTACDQASQGLSHQGTWWSGCFLKFSCDGKFLLITSRLVVDSGSSRQSPQRGWGTPAPFPQHRNQIPGGNGGSHVPRVSGRGHSHPAMPLGHSCQAVGTIHWLSAPDSTVLHRTSNFPWVSLQRWKNVELISPVACF